MAESIRVVLVDDEPLALKGLALRLESVGDVDVIDTCANGREAIKSIKTHRPDLVFLDIQMPGLDGFAVVRSLLGLIDMPLIIFVTAFDQYAVEAFETYALDYLLKPVEEQRLEGAMYRARERLAERRAVEQNARLVAMFDAIDGPGNSSLASFLGAGPVQRESEQRYFHQLHIKDRGRIIIVDVKDVDFIDAAGDYMCIHSKGDTHILREKMKVMERKLDPVQFQRIHRSTIINLDRVSEVHPHANGECFLVLKSGQELKVSRSYKGVVTRFLQN